MESMARFNVPESNKSLSKSLTNVSPKLSIAKLEPVPGHGRSTSTHSSGGRSTSIGSVCVVPPKVAASARTRENLLRGIVFVSLRFLIANLIRVTAASIVALESRKAKFSTMTVLAMARLI